MARFSHLDEQGAARMVDRDGKAVIRRNATAGGRASDRTGVEMEALTAVSIAALTLYDMCKAVDKGMEIGAVRLLERPRKRFRREGAHGAGRSHMQHFDRQ